jgi:hypothetical protein
MNHRVVAAIMFAEFVDLSVAVVAASNAVVCTGSLDLFIFEFAILEALFLESGLQESAAPAAAVVVGAVGLHIDKILFTHYGFDDVAQILGNGITVALADDLAGILDRELYFQVLVPV